jgi:hypothetical protein
LAEKEHAVAKVIAHSNRVIATGESVLPQGDCLFTAPVSCSDRDPIARANYYSAEFYERK